MNYRNEAGKLHRTDGPALVHANGDREWWVNGKRHRTDGPALVRANGCKEWWFNGKRFVNTTSYRNNAKLSDEQMLALVIKYGEIS